MSYGVGYVFLFPASVLDLDNIKPAKILGYWQAHIENITFVHGAIAILSIF